MLAHALVSSNWYEPARQIATSFPRFEQMGVPPGLKKRGTDRRQSCRSMRRGAHQGATLRQIERVYRSRVSEFRRVAAALLEDRDEGMDAVQDGFAAAVRKRASFRGDGDDVARLEIYLTGGERIAVPLQDNVYVIAVARTKFPARLVAFDHDERTIGNRAFSHDPLENSTSGTR
jgi:hypothetical protein